MDRFQKLLNELGQLINLPLHLDKNHACKLSINNLLHIQIEMDTAQERILIGSFICDVASGKFREEIFRKALKINGSFPRIGTLAFSPRNNQLFLFHYLAITQLSADAFASFLAQFIDTADQWRSSIENGQPGPPISHSKRSFGLRP
jgi:hypothetical protein